MPNEVTEVSRLAAGLILVVAALMKMRFPARGADLLSTFRFPGYLRRLLLGSSTVAELALGTALLLGIASTFAAIAGLILLALFTVVLSVNLRRRSGARCGCFGELTAAPAGAGAILRNLFLGGLFVAASQSGLGDFYPLHAAAMDWLVMGTAVLGLVAIALALSLIDDMALLLARSQAGRLRPQLEGSRNS